MILTEPSIRTSLSREIIDLEIEISSLEGQLSHFSDILVRKAELEIRRDFLRQLEISRELF